MTIPPDLSNPDLANPASSPASNPVVRSLAEVLAELNLSLPSRFAAWADTPLTGITHNSAWVQAGYIFVAIRGLTHDGHRYIDKAIAQGAIAVLGEGYPEADELSVPYIAVPNARQSLGDVAAIIEGHPSQKLQIIGITGTDGKTTTAWMSYHLLRAAGIATGLLSTVGYRLADGSLHHFPAHFTTPESPQVQRILREMQQSGCAAVVLEVSSHALDLERVRAVSFDVGVWTNLTPEHLDFHGDMPSYFAAKRALVERADHAVLSADDAWVSGLQHTAIAQKAVFFGESASAWQAQHIIENNAGLQFEVCSPLGTFAVQLPMIGRFNVQNAMAAMAATAHLGLNVAQLQAGMASFEGVPGRMQVISVQPRVIIDFAHTPPALEKALSTLRETTVGHLSVVVGSAGGNRDPLKRAPLGQVASQYADRAIFTEEDARDTPIWDILHEMERGALTVPAEQRARYTLCPDRRAAIVQAITEAAPTDTVLLAGKGPEDTLERAHETIAWNETEEAKLALEMRAAE